MSSASHIWYITQRYANYEHQVTFFRGASGKTPEDWERLVVEATAFTLRGSGISFDE